jgi:hypothetical protein
MRSVTAAALPEAEAERQLAAAIERHREATIAMQELGRSEAGQRVAVKVVGRAVELVAYTLRGAAAVGVPFERLLELTDWDPGLLREALERAVPEPQVVARLAPGGLDADAVAQAAETFETIRRLRTLMQRVLGDVDRDADVGARPLPAPADVEELHDRIEAAWQTWRQGLGRREA